VVWFVEFVDGYGVCVVWWWLGGCGVVVYGLFLWYFMRA